MSRINKLLSLAALTMAMCNTDNSFGSRRYNYHSKPKEITERQRQLFREHKTLREFTIQGHKIMAYSKKDAITRLTHQGLIKRKKKKVS